MKPCGGFWKSRVCVTCGALWRTAQLDTKPSDVYVLAAAGWNPLRWLLIVHAIFEPLPPRPVCVRVGGEELESLSPAPREANLLLFEGSINISRHVKLRGAGYITPALPGAAARLVPV